MFARRRTAKRFSLLLLEDEEDYVTDWVTSCKWPSSVEGNWQALESLPGRLRLCTKSLFFEPDDVRVPIVRLEFAAVLQLESENAHTFVVGVNKVTKMKPNMADVPYTIERNRSSTWYFSLMYAKLDSFMPLAQEQLVLSRLPTADRLPLLDASVRAREDAARFDTSRLVEFSERLVWEGPAVQLSPLVREPGRLAVTDQRVYFQPLQNITGDTPVRSHPLAAVAAVVRRRSSLRPVGLELFLLQPGLDLQQPAARGGPVWDAPSAFFCFRSEADRDTALAALTAQPALGAAVTRLLPAAHPGSSSSGGGTSGHQSQLVAAGQLLEAAGGWLQRVTLAWQLGKVSNFDYLLYLNLAAGRSFNDLAQWPVFPWVLRDYSSAQLDLSGEAAFRDLTKPMGAQTPQRLEVFRQRYRDLQSIAAHHTTAADADHAAGAAPDLPAPFMYGTHYSTPGYVMYWLVRAAPGHMLRLQAGRFDAPDRLFVSLASSWDSATSSTTDVKELIPEFFMPGPEFLVNGSQLALGIRQSGRPVGDVELPPWAPSPAALLALHRAALEAPYVSRHLHHWIDLIFGYKQTGSAAVEADNVFYHLTYEGAVDISKVTSLQELKALETQINEFGQTPRQLFTTPHPARLVAPPAPDPATVFAAAEQIVTEPASSNGSASSSAGGLPPAAAGTSGSRAWLKGGGEDAAGGAICFALLKTILAAAGPDIQPAAPAADSAAAAGAAVAAVRSIPRAAGGLQSGDDELLQSLSPVSSGDLLSPASSSPNTTPAPAWYGSNTTPASSRPLGAGPSRLQQLQQQQQQQQGGGLRGMLSRLSEGAVAAAGSVASAVQGSSSSAVPAAGSGNSSGMKLSLSWMQQQFAEGLALSGGAAAAARSRTPSPVPPAAAAADAAAAAASGGGGAAAVRRRHVGAAVLSWPRDLPKRLLVKKSLRLQSEPLTATAIAPGGGTAVAVGHNGMLRVLDVPSLSTLRAAKLEDGADLLCLALLPGPAGAAELPLVVAGSVGGRLVAFAAAAGQAVGSCSAHEDALSSVLLLGSGAGPGRLATASYDCSVKVWDVGEGRQPWCSTLPLPLLELRDFEAGVWALAGSASGQLLVTGSEEGSVAAWDLRCQQQVWATQVSSDYVGGVSLLPGGNYVAAAAADGAVSLLEWRRSGERVASASCAAPLRCCTSDGNLLISGTEAGQLLMWNLSQFTGQQQAAGGSLRSSTDSFSLAGPDGLYPPLLCGRKAAVNGAAVGVCGGGSAMSSSSVNDIDGSVARPGPGAPSFSSSSPLCHVLAALDDGTLVLFSNT